MKILSVLIVVAIATTAYISVYGTGNSDLEMQFTSYMNAFNKNYLTEEEYNFRLRMFEDSLRVINEHNAKGKSWTMGLNQFSDWTKEEYKSMLGYKRHNNVKNDKIKDWPVNCPTVDPQDIDWKQKGYVTGIKNQGKCGSCWAFSAVGSLEGAYFKKTGQLVSFSEQQIVACDHTSHGCNGGLMENGFIHWMRTAPRTEDAYPYNIDEAKVCREEDIPTSIPELEWGYRVDIGWQCLYDSLQHGPVSVAIRAENDDFRHYTGGIIDGSGCGIDLDHGVLAVAYHKNGDYWLVKNSWGETWGEAGYVRIRRGEDEGICGINQENSQAVYVKDW